MDKVPSARRGEIVVVVTAIVDVVVVACSSGPLQPAMQGRRRASAPPRPGRYTRPAGRRPAHHVTIGPCRAGMPTATVATVSVTTTDRAVSAAWQGRLDALADHSLGGRAFCRRLAAATDVWIEALAAQRPRAAPAGAQVRACWRSAGSGAVSSRRTATSTCCSCTTASPPGLEEVASAIWYPVWDAGLKLGHAVRSVDEQIELAKHDLDTATSLLTARRIAGDAKLGAQVVENGLASWTKRRKQWLELLQQTRPRAPGERRRGGVHPRARPQGRPRRHPRRAVAVVGRARRTGALGEDDAALDECYDVLARRPASSCTARPGGRATRCGWRTRTRRPRRPARRTPTP